MSPFSFIPLGVGDAFSALYYSSCVALEAEGAWLLVDCPHPIRKMMREAGQAAGIPLDLDKVSGIALTHLHADHASGLEGFAFALHFAAGRKARLVAHPEVAAGLWEGHLAAGMGQTLPEPQGKPEPHSLQDFFEVSHLPEGEVARVGPFAIECRRTIHHIPTTAFRIRAGGRCLGYSADTAFDPGLIEWLSAADLIVHETNLGVHTPYEKLAALPEALRARMRLIHYPDDFNAKASVIEVLNQGRRYAVQDGRRGHAEQDQGMVLQEETADRDAHGGRPGGPT